ncbi:MAG: 50S ribosomal protein L10 [Oscillospiraceae bacterium]|nr:50S ribosomal protein L10 [Oscillospiraceae bacterium]
MPSPAILDTKKQKVDDLTKLISSSVAGVLVDYRGITVEEDTKLRRDLRESNISYKVVKNSILSFAFKNAGLDFPGEILTGTTSLALSFDDQTAPARLLGGFAEECGPDKFFLKAGFIDKDIYDTQRVTALSKIPPKDILLAQLVGSLQGPIQKLAALLKAVADSKQDAQA